MNGDMVINADSTENSNVQQVDNVGGIAGYLEEAAVTDAKIPGDIKINATGMVQLGREINPDRIGIGGEVGYARYSGFSRINHSGSLVSENVYYVGGIIGKGEDAISITRSVNSGAITTVNDVATSRNADDTGGIMGYADEGILISSSSNSGAITVSGSEAVNVGGIIGYSDDAVAIHDSYNRGNISGKNNVAGIIGRLDSQETVIATSYTTGTVTITGDTPENGDVVANNYFEPAATATASFDKQTTNSPVSSTGIVGKTTSAMKSLATFQGLGWSIGQSDSVWKISSNVNNGCPYIVAVPNSPKAAAPAAVRDLLGPVAFKSKSAKLTKSAKAKLAIFALTLKAGGYDKVTVKAYTMSTNTKLSVKRANAVAKYLNSKGVSVKLYKEAVTQTSKTKNNKAWIVAVKNAAS